MIRVAFVRHGPTAWNAEGRLQGRRDVPLSAEGRVAVRRWCLPHDLARGRCLTSPLTRARETAALLGFDCAGVEARLIEMDWGSCEGATLAELRRRDSIGFAALESRGLDFQPPGGESPRAVCCRLETLLRELAASKVDHVLVTHKGVIRAAIVLATGWDMITKPPLRLCPDDALLASLDGSGRLHATQILPLVSHAA